MTDIDLGAIYASVGLNLKGLMAGATQITATVSGIKTELASLDSAGHGSQLAAGLTPIPKQLGVISTGLAALPKLLGGISVGFTLAGAAAGKLAADFDSSMTRIADNTTMNDEQLQQMKKTVMELGKESGASFDDLAGGLAHVTNYGYTGATAIKILREAMISAVSTGSQVSDTANVLAGVLKEFNIQGSKSAEVMNSIHIAAASGNTVLSSWADATARTYGAAANLGVGLGDVNAAMSALTQHGFPDIFAAAIQVQNIMVHMVRPTSSMVKELERLQEASGVPLVKDFTRAGLAAKGLHGVFLDLQKAIGGNTEEYLKVIPALHGGLGAMALGGTAAEDYTKKLSQQADALSGKINPSLQGYNRVLKTVNNEMARASNEIKADFIPAGEKIGPLFAAALPVIKDAAKALATILDVFTKLPKPIQEGVFALGALGAGVKALNLMLGVNVGAGLIGGLGKVAELLGSEGVLGSLIALAPEIAAVVAAVALLAVAWVRDWGHVREFTVGVWNGIKSAAKRSLEGTVEAGLVLKDAWKGIVNGMKSLWHDLTATLFVINLDPVTSVFKSTFDKIKAIISTFTRWVSTELGGIGKTIATWWDHTAVGSYLNAKQKAAEGIVNGWMGGGTAGKATPGAGGQLVGPVGNMIAAAALQEQMSGDYAKYVHHCQQLARVTVEQSTHIFDKMWADTALKTLNNFKKAGFAQPYKPGMALAPGTLLYSSTLGNGSGHVQTVDMQGNRLDQYGKNHFPLKDFQFYVNPNRAVNLASARNGGSRAPGPPAADASAADPAALSDLHDRLYAATHDKFQNRKHEAKATYQTDKASDPIAAKKLYLATLRQIDKDEEAEQKRNHDQIERQLKAHNARVAAAKKKAASDLKAGLKSTFDQNREADTDAFTGLAMPLAEDAGKKAQDAGDADRKDNYLYAHGQMSAEAYKAYLTQRLSDYTTYSQEWIGISDQIDSVNSDMAAHQKALTAAFAAQIKVAVAAAAAATKAHNQALNAGTHGAKKPVAAGTQVWKDAIKDIRTGMDQVISVSIEHWNSFKGFFKSLTTSLKDMLVSLAATLAKDYIISQIFGSKGTPGAKQAGKQAAASPVSAVASAVSVLGALRKPGDLTHVDSSGIGLKGMGVGRTGMLGDLGQAVSLFKGANAVGGLLGGIGGLFGKKKVSPTSVADATPVNIVGISTGLGAGSAGGGNSALSTLGGLAGLIPGGGLAGGILKGIGSVFHFAGGGVVPGIGFRDSVPAMLTPGETVIPRGGMKNRRGGDTHITVNHFGDVYGHEGKQSAGQDMAWIIKQRLAVTTPGI